MFVSRFKFAAVIGTALVTCTVIAAPVLHTTDFIADGSRSNFNGFESIPNDGTYYTGGSGPYVEDGVSVRQVNGDAGNSIWIGYSPAGKEGRFSWYPDGGDFGYTAITRSGGANFANVGMLIGSGFGNPTSMAYELLEAGVVVLFGTLPAATSFHYIGFSGGGFDTVRLRDSNAGGVPAFNTPSFNALTLDSIELSGGTVSEPAPLALLGIAGLGAGLFARRRKV